jgi:hypothetical protein
MRVVQKSKQLDDVLKGCNSLSLLETMRVLLLAEEEGWQVGYEV